MTKFTEKALTQMFPTLCVEEVVVFPSIPTAFDVNSKASAELCEKVYKENAYLFVCTYVQGEKKNGPLPIGTVCKVVDVEKYDDGGIRLTVQGLCRAEVAKFAYKSAVATVVCKTVVADNMTEAMKGDHEEAVRLLNKMQKVLPRAPKEVQEAIAKEENPGMFCDLIASTMFTLFRDRYAILEEFDPANRLALLVRLMRTQLKMLDEELHIHKLTRQQVEENQRDYYLREQLKVLKRELGEDEEYDEEINDYLDRIEKAELPEEAGEKLIKETKKLAKLPYASPESNVIRSYLDACLELPWNKTTEDSTDLDAAKKILDNDHDGMDDIKNRILEFIAVRKMQGSDKNQILCLVGAPGVGKTSVAASIAKALKRKYVRIALGGVRDEADIRGHRKTYIGAMPGRIIDAITRAGVRNPLILLDEIDKLTTDAHGDPASALLEVLDPDQNKAFRDHFIELPFDLSDCLFIATANTLDTVSRPLLDRMEVIEMKSYSRLEKLSIAKNHLIGKQLKKHGLRKVQLRFEDSAIFEIIDHYTCEAGVRNLERRIAEICRKTARKLLENPEKKSYRLKASDIVDYLGAKRVLDEKVSEKDEIGVVNGLAYTDAGGDLLKAEAITMPGTGKLEITGSLGDVMKESAQIAMSLVRARAAKYGIDPEFHKKLDLHVHFPEGAVPKDGPSAGVTLVTVLVSALGSYPVRSDIAMTGEITLRGKIIPIGGLREKTMAAYKAGVKTVLVPEENRQDYEKLDDFIKNSLEFVFCENIDQVLAHALVMPDNAEKDFSELLSVISGSAKIADHARI